MNAPNLSSLLNKPADEVKRPVALPDGTYYGIIKSHQFTESKQKKTPGVEYTVGLTHAHDDVDLSDFNEEGGTLDEKQMRTTFWLSDGALFMLTDFITSCGVESAGRSLGELIPQVHGQPVVLDVVRKPTESGEGFFNQVRSVKGANAE
jgi:hypothetical protein